MSVMRKGLALVAAVTTIVPAGMASAQSSNSALRAALAQSGDLFARDRAVAVRDRAHPEYEALGLPAGAFTVFPRLQADVEYNDNVYATENGALDDVIFRVKPELAVESGWSRHFLQAYVRGDFSRYSDYGTEDTNNWGIGSSGRVDINRAANIALGADYAELTEPRTSSNTPVASAKPIEYDLTQAYIAATRVTGRLKLSGRGDFRSFDYRNGETLTGAVIDQSNRNRDVSSLSGRVDYAISPATAVFVQVTGNDRSYKVASTPTDPNRDSSGYEALVGVNFEVGAVARGELAVGYISQEYDSSAFSNIDGFGARAQVQWFPTELTTFTATGSRTIEDSGIVGSGGYLSNGVGLAVDHELLRNVILSANTNFSRDEYNGIDRNDDRFSIAAGGTYLLNRNLGVSVTASHLKQSSDGANAGVKYNVNRVMLSLVSQF